MRSCEKESEAAVLDPRIRFKLHHASPQEVASARAQWKNLRWRALPPESVEDCLQEMENPYSLTEARIRPLALHPDERVPLFLYRHRKSLRTPGLENTVCALLLARGFIDNERRGTLWNPLLEALSISSHSFYHGNWPGIKEAKLFGAELRWRSASAALTELQEKWSTVLEEAENSNSLLESMALSRGKALTEWITTKGNALPRSLFPRLLSDTLYFSSALDNSKIRIEDRKALFEEVRKGLKRWKSALNQNVGAERLFPLLARQMAERGEWEPTELQNLLLSHLESEENPSFTRDSRAEVVRRVLAQMLSEMDEQKIRRLYPFSKDERWIIQALSRTKNTPLDILREIAHQHSDFQTRSILSRNEAAISDPEICLMLGKSRSSRIKKKVLTEGTGPAYRKLVRNVMLEDPHKALELIRKREEDSSAMESLERTDLTPAFQDSSPEVREAALGVLGKLAVDPKLSSTAKLRKARQ